MQYCTPAGGEKQVSFRKMLFRVYCVHCPVHVETMFSLPYIKPRLTLFYFPSKLVMAVSNIYSPQFPDFYSSITLSSSSPLHLFSFVITLSCLHIFLLVLRQAQNVFHTHISPQSQACSLLKMSLTVLVHEHILRIVICQLYLMKCLSLAHFSIFTCLLSF